MSSTYGTLQYNGSMYNAGPLPTTALVYRTNYNAFVRHNEYWPAGSEHELEPLVAVGLMIIYPLLLVSVDGTPMPSTPLKGRALYAQAISAANGAIIHSQRGYAGEYHAVRDGARRIAIDTAG